MSKSTNLNPHGRQGAITTLGEKNPNRATGRGIRIVAPGVDIEPVVIIRPPWALELDDDEVQIGSEVAQVWTNDSGGALDVGDVVVLVGTTVITTTAEADTRTVGVVIVAAADGEPVIVQTHGRVALVTVVAPVTAGNFGETSTTAGAAQESVVRHEGSCMIFLTDGAAPSAYLFGVTDAAAVDVSGLFQTTNLGGQNGLTIITSSGSSFDIDCSLGNVFHVTLDDDCAYTISNPPPSGVEGKITLVLIQGGAGGFTVTHPGSVDWQDTDGTGGGAAPTLFTVVGAQDVIELATLDGGTSWGGSSQTGGGSGGAPATTVESETTFGITPAVGTDTEYARQDHTHGSPANPVSGAAIATLGFVGPLVITDTPSTPLVFADILQNEAQDDLIYADL